MEFITIMQGFKDFAMVHMIIDASTNVLAKSRHVSLVMKSHDHDRFQVNPPTVARIVK